MKVDVLFATFVFILALVVSGAAYKALVEVERPEQEMLRALALGESSYAVTQGDSCIGNFKTEVKTEPDVTIISDGEMRFLFAEKPVTVLTFVGVLFNALDQMVSFNLHLDTEDIHFRFITSNTNPVRAVVTVDFQGRQYERSFSAPGPVMLRKNQDGTFRVDYSVLTGSVSGYANAITQLPTDQIDINVTPIANGAQPCRDAGTGRLVLDPLVDQARTFLAKWQGGNFLGMMHQP